MQIRTPFLLLFTFYSYFIVAQERHSHVSERQADSLYYTQHTKYSESNNKKALGIRQNTLLKINDSSSFNYKRILAKLYASKAANLESKQKFDSAIYYSKKSIKILAKLEKQNLFFKGHAYMHLYAQTAYNGDWKTAAKYCKEALQTLKDTLGNKHILIPEIEFDYGYSVVQLGDYITGLKYYNLSKDHFISLIGENNHEVALKYSHLAKVSEVAGYYNKELEAYKKAIKIWETIDYKDKSYLSIVYGSIGKWYLQHGEFDKAEQYLKKKEKLIKKKKGKIWFNETYKGRTKIGLWDNYATLNLHKKDTVNALLYTNKVLDYLNNLDVNDKRNNPNNVSFMKTWVRNSKILFLRKKANLIKNSKPEEANSIFNYILSQKEKNKFSHSTSSESINLSQYFAKNKAFKKAHNILNKALVELNTVKESYLVLQLYAAQATLYFKENKIIEMHKKYKVLFKTTQHNSQQHINLKDLRYKNCKPYGTKNYLNLVLKASNNYTNAYKKTNNKTYLQIAHNLNLLASEMFAANYAILNYNNKTYKTAITINERLLSSTLLLDDQSVFDDALQKIEQSGSRLSWRKFLNSKQRKYINIPDSILIKESDLKRQLHFFKKTLFLNTDNNEEKINLWKEKIFDLKNEIERLKKWYDDNYPSYFNQTQQSFNIAELKQKFKNNQQIIKYTVAEENIYAFVITKNKTDLINLGKKDVLNKKIKLFIASLSETNSNNYKKQAKDIYNILLPEPLLDDDSKRQNLVFIQDNILNFIPMETLLDVNDKYLIQSHSVSYAPSLLLWNEQLKVKKARRNKLGVFAPIYKDYYEKNPKRNDSTALLGAFSEAIRIADIFESDVYSGVAASKEAFITKANDYNMLHLAMHSTINNADAEFSNLSFSPDKTDNKLFISELYNISLNADMAVLSACNTGAGTLIKGEGLMNISRAFTYAGVPSLVTSLWSVPDKETAEIMVSFYSYLKKGKSKNEALQLAKLKYLKNATDEKLKHPYYWAGFIISGDTSPITSSTPYGKYALGVSILFLGIYFLRKRNVNILKS